MSHAPGANASILDIVAQLHELLPSEFTSSDLGRQSLSFFHGPTELNQAQLVVVDNANRQVKRHRIGLAIDDVAIEHAVNESIVIQGSEIHQHASLNHGRNVRDGEDVRSVAVLVGEDQVLAVLAPINALIILFELNLDVLAFGGVTLLKTLSGGNDSIRDRHKVIVVSDLQGDGFSHRGNTGQRQAQRHHESNQLADVHGKILLRNVQI